MSFTTTTTTLTLILLFLLFSSTVSAHHHFRKMSENDFCKFNETLKSILRELDCNMEWDECATKIREIVQYSASGTWGVIIVGNETDIMEERIDWHISSYPSEKCRIFVNNDRNRMLIEIFRTGLLGKDVYEDKKQWKSFQQKNATTLTLSEVCPHSALRNIISSTWIDQPPHSRHRRHSSEIQLHESARRLSISFHEQTSHDWNVFIVKLDLNYTLSVGFEFPYYHYNAQPGFCIAKSQDGYMVVAVVNEYLNDTFNELLFLL